MIRWFGHFLYVTRTFSSLSLQLLLEYFKTLLVPFSKSLQKANDQLIEAAEDENIVLDTLQEAKLEQEIEVFLNCLSYYEKKVLYLRFTRKHSFHEVAGFMQMPVGEVIKIFENSLEKIDYERETLLSRAL